MKPRLFKPFVSWRAILNVVRVLLGTQLSEGKEVKLFEHEFGKRFGLKNVVAVNSGTSALELAYELAGIEDGDEVITPVLTCTATNIPLLRRKAKIVFADINYDLNIDIEDVKRKLTKRTKAIVFVHFGGNNRGLRELLELCKAKSITLIEDAAQAVGSDYWGQGDFTCVSLQAIKILTSGDGGFLTCKRKKDYEKAKRLRWFGYDREKKHKEGDTDIKEAGYKYHMNNITAAIGRGNLACLDRVLAKRKKLRDFYNSKFPVVRFSSRYKNKPIQVSQHGIECHNWLCIQWSRRGEQHHYRNDKYTVFKPFKNHCPKMDSVDRMGWRLLPFHHGVSIREAEEAIYSI